MQILIALGVIGACFLAFSAYACVRVGAEAERAAERAYRNALQPEPEDGVYTVDDELDETEAKQPDFEY